jgi:hypothetical protein
MTPKDVSLKFIAKLVRLTSEGSLRWASTPSPVESRNALMPVSAAFRAELDGRTMRIYQKRTTESGLTDTGMLGGGAFGGGGGLLGADSQSMKVIVTVLELLNEFDQVNYKFEDLAGLSDLYEAAAFSASDLKDWMEGVLNR